MLTLLDIYLIRRFSLWLLIVLSGFATITMLSDILEMLRLANSFDLTASAAFFFSLQRLPHLMFDLLPFVFLFATAFCLLRLSQAHELVAIRASGVSVWQFLRPLLIFTFVLAVATITLLEPLGTRSFNAFKDTHAKLTGIKPQLSFSTGGVWFRENSDNGNYIIRAEKLDAGTSIRLLNVDITVLTAAGDFSHRISAEDAVLATNLLTLNNAQIHMATDLPIDKAQLYLPTRLTQESLQANFKPPHAVNIWQLPRYISQAHASGIDVTRHQARFQSLLALPALLLSMVMVAACFSLPTGRVFSPRQTLGLSILSGVLLFLVNDFIGLIGEINIIPTILASWMPALIALLLSVSYLLTTEDG